VEKDVESVFVEAIKCGKNVVENPSHRRINDAW